jgi:starch synthase (maltosyl-transferring)
MLLHGFNSQAEIKSSQTIEKRLRLYNQYPGCYQNFAQMTQDLKRIKDLGFKQVWVNPFFETCKENFLNPAKKNCPYAMKSHTQLNPEYGTDFEDVKKYTQRANELGLVPLFDLVARHVAIDHPFVSGDPELLSQGIDTTKWFLRHANGNFVIRGMDENYIPTKSDPWSDVIEFIYGDPVICQQIFEHFWKPFIDFNIETLGFEGARLDAVGSIAREAHQLILPYIEQACKRTHGKSAYLVAETVGLRFLDYSVVVKDLVTHTMNNSYWMPGPEGRKDRQNKDVPYSIWTDDKNWHETSKRVLQAIAPSAGHSGSHDEDRYPAILESKGVKDNATIQQRMLEMIMVAAFGSDGGHILAYGDEYGITDRVNLLNRRVINVTKEKKYDLSRQIKEINKILTELPEPTSPERTQRIFYAQYPELVIFLVHQGEGSKNNSHLIIGNTTDKNITITQTMLHEIIKANGRNRTRSQTKLPDGISLCGNLDSHWYPDPRKDVESDSPKKKIKKRH